MKFCVIIMDGASGWPLPDRYNKTCLEIASTPNLDSMTQEGLAGMALTVPRGMEPSSACACMSVMGYDPMVYYRGRSGIEACSMGIPVNQDEVVFRCNLVTVLEGKMMSYSAGHISTDEAGAIIETLNAELGSESISFFPGVNYRHICKLKNRPETLNAACTPPHDITDRPVAEFLPRGEGAEFLKDLMGRSVPLLTKHPINIKRENAGILPATMIWLFWASGQIPAMPSFAREYGLKAAMTSGVDLLKGLAKMADMEILQISGVTDGLDNNYTAQTEGALKALERNDLVILHIEAPDEMGHRGSIEDKVKAIELIDREVIGRIRTWRKIPLRVLVMPDHPTPIEIKTHCGDAVPFLIWGESVKSNGAVRFTEAEAGKTGAIIEPGYKIMGKLIKGG